MYKKNITLLLVFICFIFCLITYATTKDGNNKSIIAIVEGKKITKSDVYVDKNIVAKNYVLLHVNLTEEELKEKANKIMKRKLISKIKQIIKENRLKQFKITATNEEARKLFESIYPGLKDNPKFVLKKEQEQSRALVEGLKEVLKNPDKKKEIYEKKMKNYMSYETWESVIIAYGTQRKIKLIEKAIPKTIEDIYKSAEQSMKQLVLDKKLREAITKDVTVTEEELKTFYEYQYRGKEEKPKLEEVKEKIKQQILEIKRREKEKEWWKRQYKEAEIEIKDDAFKDVIKYFKGK